MDDFVSGAGPHPPADDLAFIPLGGTGEIGMNLNLYRCDGAVLAVDCGIGFGGPDLPEADIVVPDPAWIAERSSAARSTPAPSWPPCCGASWARPG